MENKMATGGLDYESFKNKLLTDDDARADFVKDFQELLQRRGVDTANKSLMEKFGIGKDLKDINNVARTVVITVGGG